MKTLLTPQKRGLSGRLWQGLLPLLALFVSLGSVQSAWAAGGTNFSFLTLRATPTTGATTTTTYYGTDSDPASGRPAYDPTAANPPGSSVNDLGLFDLNSGQLVVTAAQFNVFTTGSSNATSGRLFYRTYLVGATDLPAYTPINLSTVAVSGPSNPRTLEFSTNSSTNNVLSGLLSGGIYELEFFFQATGTGTGLPITDQNGQTAPPTPFRARFRVVPPAVTPPGALTIWNGSVSSDWTNPANWSNGVPNALADATIPFERNVVTDQNQIPRFPILNDLSKTYAVRNLTVQAVSFTNRGLIRVTNAVLRIFGDLDNGANGILATADQIPDDGGTTFQSATISFEGGDQRINRGRFANVVIAGSGIKSLTGLLDIAGGTVRFRPSNPANGVLLRTTAFDATGQAFVSTLGDQAVDLGNDSEISLLPGEAETNTSFILGLTKADAVPTTGNLETFGNIGLDVTTGTNLAGKFDITRSIGPFFVGPVGTSARSVKRVFAASVGNSNVDIMATISFHYNDSNSGTGGLSIDELNGNSEPNLLIFRTQDSGASFQNLGGVVNVGTNVVTTTGVRSINTITLGDRERPLPVGLTSFVAQRSGKDAVLTWTTVTELNNRGFELQVSATGRDFRTLGFIRSQASDGTASHALTYRYLDTEANKSGVRYYRLRQLDLDGKENFYGPRVVSFSGSATADARLEAYPNPFQNDVRLTVQSAAAGKGQLQLLDLTGRVVLQRAAEFTTGTNDLELLDLSNVQQGTYMLRVVPPTGKAQTQRIIKQ